MSRSWLFLAAIAATTAACGSSVTTGTPTSGSGGETTTTSGGVTTTGTTGSTGTTGAGGGTTGGAGGAGACDDPQNPLFGSCLVAFLAGCWMPDESGTCTSMDGTTAWSDGSKYVTTGSMPGLYGPGDTTPCISMVISGSTLTGTKGSEKLTYEGGSSTSTITCPDGSMITATNAQVTEFNTCFGLNCP
jgi:hypothetical protein